MKSLSKANDNRINLDLTQQLKSLDEQFILNTNKKIKKVIRASELIKIEADGSYSKFYLADGSVIMNSYNIAKHEKKITNPLFFRIHKSYIINLCYVTAVTPKSPMIITLRNSETVIASRRKEKLIRARISQLSNVNF